MVKIMFIVDGKEVGFILTSLEGFDASTHIIPKRIINRFMSLRQSLEIKFEIQ